MIGLHKEGICCDSVTHQWWVLPWGQSGVTPLGPWHGRFCPCGQSSTDLPVLSRALPKLSPALWLLLCQPVHPVCSSPLLTFPRAGRTGAANLSPAELSSLQPALYQKRAAGMLFLSHSLGWLELCCQSKVCFCSVGNRMDLPVIPPNVIYSTGKCLHLSPATCLAHKQKWNMSDSDRNSVTLW